MNITVTQNNSNIEWVTSNIIKKMYQLAMDPNNTVSYSGYLKSASGYAGQVQYLNNTFGPGLRVEATKEYLEFEDPATEQVCATYFGDGVGCTIQELQGATDWGSKRINNVLFVDALTNANAKKFNEFQYLPTTNLWYMMFGDYHTLEEITLPNTPLVAVANWVRAGQNPHDVVVHNATSITHFDQYGTNGMADGYILDFSKFNGRFENNGYGRSEIAGCGNEYMILARNSVLNRTSSDNFEMTSMYYVKTVVFREDFVCAGLNLKGYGNNGYGFNPYTSITSIVFLGTTPPFSSINLSWNQATLYAPSSATSAYSTASGKTVQPLETFANISDANKDILVEAGCTVTGSTGNWTVTPPTA